MAQPDGTFEPIEWPARCTCGSEFTAHTLFPPEPGMVLDRPCSLCLVQAEQAEKLRRERKRAEQQASDSGDRPMFARPRRAASSGGQLRLDP